MRVINSDWSCPESNLDDQVNEPLPCPAVHKNLPMSKAKISKHSAADPNACAVCFCLGYSGPFVSDTSPKSIDREGLGESRTGTRQGSCQASLLLP